MWKPGPKRLHMILLPVSTFCIILLIPHQALTEKISSKPVFTWNCWNWNCWLATPGWSGKAAEVPSAHSSNITPARHNHYLRGFKTSDHSGTYSALGSAHRGSRWEETQQVPGTGGDVQGKRLEDILWACRSGLQKALQVVLSAKSSVDWESQE